MVRIRFACSLACLHEALPFLCILNDCLHRMQSDESETDQSDTNSVKFTAELNIVYMYKCYWLEIAFFNIRFRIDSDTEA